MEKIYYLDNAATTKTFEEIYDKLKEINENYYFNPSSAYMQSINTKKILDDSRNKITKLLGGSDGKLLFTSSATESNNMIFNCLHLRKGQVVLISKGEHPSVYLSAHNLEKNGIIVKDIELKEDGTLNESNLLELLSNDVALVSVMHVSNETGAINDIKNICSIVKNFNSKIIFHSDGVQAFGKFNINLKQLGVDLYTISAHKIYAPRGIAGLWIKNNTIIDPLLLGGGQENNLRSSTENVTGAVAFAFAAEKVINDLEKNYDIAIKMKNNLVSKLYNSKIAKYIKINSFENNIPHILSISFDKIKGEVLMHMLEADGILLSTGSACSSKKAGNRTLETMGLSQSYVIGSIRISFSPYNEYDLDYIANCIEKNVLKLEENNR